MRTLLIIRHGESTADIEHRVGGSYDDDLTDLGRSQAERLAARVARDYKIDRLYASPLQRAAQTAEAIAAATGVRPTFDDRLRERSTGDAAGLVVEEALRRYPLPPSGMKLYTVAPRGESALDQFRRVAEFYLQLRDSSPATGPGTVAIVTHGGTLRCLVRLVLGLPVDTHISFGIEDTCLYEFEFGEGTTVVRRMNDTSHLTPREGRPG